MKCLAVFVAFLIAGCTPLAPFGDGAPATVRQIPPDPCAKAGSDARMAIEVANNNMASVCRADGVGDCLYTHAFGKTFVYARPDLNSDGHEDYLIKDFSGAYGVHEVTHFMGFVSCPGKTYVKVLDDFLTEIHFDQSAPSGTWSKLQVSRSCFDETSRDVVTRAYQIEFDQVRSRYGFPDENKALGEYCGPVEVALPATKAGD